ncbi:hypothetical protein [Mycobacteroides abscessus]|uniref:hypothetical protein n=1 Tax=Mycobacteroides abscessus TaxID=36809 RepID=UPI00092BADDC|nr:hypothetical protein [Mycobacteroides abscessus]DAZ90347.1 TPA_asm: hypothetical protein PROPHIFSQJ01-1_61 [Mycobacterium phage prophiFSQJ01-1]SII41356.1 Uncharacterised protein [Mycobacteroides abscessus subsp. abscessus]SIK13825.1 Uncharacterised protein [Mycobacteroides abscessus subsp. abscessus]SIN25596.1 Uncharacterised protein [Mycobacteroides abscessus subsp. abscessus]SLI51321.1 Uncharacterised protein [Mycobacteroides abscessus subsp. abscessus]
MITVHLKDGTSESFNNDDQERCEWETEEQTDHLVVSTPTRVAIFHGESWSHLVEDRKDTAGDGE